MTSPSPERLVRAFAFCRARARTHYENFPVASFLLPASLRPAVAAIYCVARHADDLADEGDTSPEERRLALDRYAAWIRQAPNGIEELDGPDSLVLPLLAWGEVVRRYGIPVDLMLDLLDAFVQDTRVTEYDTWDQLLDYCRRSANPVGRMLLVLCGCCDERTAPLSDALCTALQVTNFWQDLSIDSARGRCYLPGEDRDRFGVSLSDLASPSASPALRRLMMFEVERSESVFSQSTALLSLVPSRLRKELAAVHWGGRRILERIRVQNGDVLTARPILTRGDILRMLFTALRA